MVASTMRTPAGRAAGSGARAAIARHGSWRAARDRGRARSTSSSVRIRWKADMRRRAFVACALLAAGGALAQSYPDRPVKLVVAFVPGGATDTLSRQILGELSQALGQPVVIENRPGANGYLGWNHVASAAPDGYTLLMAENALAMSQALFRKAASGFDPLKQYDAIATVASSPMVLVVANGVKAKNVQALDAPSKTRAQKMNYAPDAILSIA